MVGFRWTDRIPEGTKALANLLKEDFKQGTLAPFLRKSVSQDTMVRNDGTKAFTAEDVLHMDWLCDNMHGSIPDFEILTAKCQAITRPQGIYRDRIPPQIDCIQI